MAKKTLKATEKDISSFEKNYAKDDSVADRFMKQVQEKIFSTRKNRLEKEDQWLDDVRLWSCVLDDQGYVGRSNVFVPEIHNQVEVGVEKMLGTMFQGLDFIKAVPMRGTVMEKAEKIQAAVAYELEGKNQIFTKWDEWERQKILLGTSIWKCRFDEKFNTIYTRNKDGKPIIEKIPVSHGVVWDKVDLFHWYIFPEVATIKTAEIIFEDMFVAKDVLEEEGELYANLDRVPEIPDDTDHKWSDIEQLSIVSLATAATARKSGVFLTEVWTTFKLTERSGRVPVKAIIANNSTVIQLKRNPYWFQSHPFLAERYLKRPGNIFYGFSLPDKIRSLNYQMNDLTNHTMDSLNYTLNPITVIDPALAGDVNTMKVSPGAKWLGSPQGIEPMMFPDVSGSGLRAMQEIRGQIAQFSDSTPGIAPQLQGKARSATQASLVQMAVSQRQLVQAKNEEVNVLIPMCQMTHSLLEQYMSDEWQIKYQGAEKGSWIVENMKPGDIYGRVEFIWMGASAQEKTAVRSQQLLAFFNQAVQMATMMPGEIDLVALFKRIAREAFELQDIDDIFKSLRDAKTVSPEVENIALLDGEEVPVHNGDDDDGHMETHSIPLDDPDVTDEQKLRILNHNEKHKAQKQAKMAVIQLQARLKALQSEMGAADGAEANEGGDGRMGPAVPSPMEGNQSQVPTSEASVMTGAQGVNFNL